VSKKQDIPDPTKAQTPPRVKSKPKPAEYSPTDRFAEQIRHVYQRADNALALNVLLIAVVFATFFPAPEGLLPTLKVWIVYMTIASGLLGLLLYLFKRTQPTGETTCKWIMPITIWCVLGALGWAAAGILFQPHASMQQTVILYIALFAAGLGVITRFSAVPLTAQLFNALVFLPVAAYLVYSDAFNANVLGGSLAGMWAVNALISTRLKKHSDHIVQLRFENRGLLDYLSRSKAQLESLNHELEREVDQRKQMAEDLKLAQRNTEAANMAKDEFLATMSHEIRTPLNGILPLLDILRDTHLDPDQQDYLNTAFQSSKHMLRLIDDILDYSKIEAGKLELECISLNLRSMVADACQLMRGAAERKGLTMVNKVDPKVRRAVRGDPVRLRQILSNLVSNAVKFTERGQVEVSAIKLGESEDCVTVRFSVSDTGIGIAPDALESLFAPFEQADTSTTRQYGGTGLGLVICKRLVELMRGKIGVESKLKRGSTFWVEIPLLKAAGDIKGARENLEKVRMLVVAKSDKNYKQLALQLDNLGMEHLRTSNAQDGYAKLSGSIGMGRSWAYEILAVLSDIGAENMVRLFTKISREQRLSAVRLVVVGDASQILTRLRQLGVAVVINDAANAREIQEKLEKLMGVGATRVAAPTVSEFFAEEGLQDSDKTHEAVEPARELAGHVLLVEDNPVNLRVAQKLLSLAKLDHDHAGNGKEAIERFKQASYDLVLMDCQMPIMDGYTATGEIRKLQKGDNMNRVPIVAMTANAMAGDREKCLAAGMDDYLAKPLSRSGLNKMLAKWLPEADEINKLSFSAEAQPPKSTKPAETTEDEFEPDITAAVDAMLQKKPAGNKPRPAVKTQAAPAQPPSAKRRQPAVNEAVIGELLEVMGEDFSLVLDAYLEDTPKLLAEIEAAASKNSARDLINPSHSLKSTSANFGAMALSKLAETIEINAKQGTVDSSTELLGQAQREFRAVKASLAAIQQQIGEI